MTAPPPLNSFSPPPYQNSLPSRYRFSTQLTIVLSLLRMRGMILNIRNFPDELVLRARKKALEGGSTLREVVIQALEDSLRLIVVAKIEGRLPRVETVIPAYEPAKVQMSPEQSKKFLIEANERMKAKKAEIAARATSQFEKVHEPKSCKLYGCGMCNAAGWKDPHRGLN